MASFAADIAKFANKTNRTIDGAVRTVVMELFAEVDRRSPVGDKERWAVNVDRKSRGLAPVPAGYIGGHFRVNNQYNFGSLPTGEIDGQDKSGSVAVATAKAGVYSAPVAGVHYIANNVPYAMALENGHSSQAPRAPVAVYGLAMITITSQLNRIVKGAAK